VKNKLRPIVFLLLAISVTSFAHAQQPAATSQSPLQKSIETYLRRAFALGSDVQITVATPTEIGNSGLLETNIDVKTTQGSDKVKMYVTRGRPLPPPGRSRRPLQGSLGGKHLQARFVQIPGPWRPQSHRNHC